MGLKDLYKKGIIFCFLCSIPVLILNWFYQKTYYFQSLNGLYKFHVMPYDMEVCNLGNSHESFGIIYEDWNGIKGYNLALESQPFQYDYEILNMYKSHLKKGAVVLIPISYFDWFYDYEKIFLGQYSAYNERYYTILKKEQILQYDFKTDLLYHHLPILSAGVNLKYIFSDIGKPDLYYPDTSIVSDIDFTADWKATSWLNNVMNLEKKNSLYKKNKYWFEQCIQFCIENDFRPVIISLPVTSQLKGKLGNEFLKEFEAITQFITSKYEEIPYMNYLKEESFERIELYKDSDHLNYDGAKKISKDILQRLIDMEYISLAEDKK